MMIAASHRPCTDFVRGTKRHWGFLKSSLPGLRTLAFCMVVLLCVPHPMGRAEGPVLAVDALSQHVLTTAHPNPIKIAAGRFTQDIERLVFSSSMITATLDPAPNLPFDPEPQKLYGSFTVTVDPAIADGYYEMWAVGRYGISNARTLLVVHAPVQPLPVAADVAQLPSLQPGICYVGQMKRSERLPMKFATAGSWPRMAIVASSFDLPTIPSIQWSDPQGQTLLRGHTVGKQPLVLPADGWTHPTLPSEIHANLCDFLFRGGETYGFALMIDPPASHPILQPPPLAGPASVAMQGLAAWPTLDPATFANGSAAPAPPWQTTIAIQPNAPPPSLEFTPAENTPYEIEVFANAADQACDVRAVVDRIPSPLTAEQRAAVSTAANATDGTAANPEIQAWKDILAARERAAPRDVVLIADDAPNAGTRAVRMGSSDILATIPPGPANKNVRVTFLDLQLSPSKKQPTLATVRIGPAIPRLHAIAHWSPDTNNPAAARTTGASIARGGTTSLHVSVRRAGGFSGPVEITIEGLPAGISAMPTQIGPAHTETEVILHAEESAANFVGPIAVIAKANAPGPDSNPMELRTAAIPTTIALNASGDRGVPQSRISQQLWLKVTEQDVAPIDLVANEGKPLELAQGAAVKIPIRATRRAGGEAKAILRPQNLPPKVSLGEFELPPNAAEAAPEIKAAADAPLGEATLWFQAEMTYKQALHPESHARAIAHRDRLQSQLADPSWNGDRAALEKAIAEATARVDALAKEVAPRDFPSFFHVAPVRVRIVAPPETPK